MAVTEPALTNVIITNKNISSEKQMACKTFLQAMQHLEENSHTSLMPKPMIKGKKSIKISHEECTKGLEDCKNNLYGRLVMGKGYKPLTTRDITEKLKVILSEMAEQKIVPFG